MRPKGNSTDGLLGSRLKLWRNSIPLKGNKLAETLKLSTASLSAIEQNKSLPSADTLAKLLKHTNLDISWLLTGEGKMCRVESAEDEDDANFPELKELYRSLKRIVMTGDDKKKEHLKGYLLGADPGK